MCTYYFVFHIFYEVRFDKLPAKNCKCVGMPCITTHQTVRCYVDLNSLKYFVYVKELIFYTYGKLTKVERYK